PAQWAPDDGILGQNDGVIPVTTPYQSPLAKTADFVLESEGSGSSELPLECVGRQLVAAALAADQRVSPFDGHRDPQAVPRRDQVAGLPVLNGEGCGRVVPDRRTAQFFQPRAGDRLEVRPRA